LDERDTGEVMRILLLGYRGYISAVLMPLLEELGHEVVPFLGLIESQKDWSVAPQRCDAVVCLAAYNDLYGCESNPLKSFYVNYWGPMLALKYCVENRARLVFTSTDTVTGLDGVPISVYDSHRYAAEKSIMSIPYQEFGGAVVLRLATVYGYSPAKSQQSNRGIINQWCKMALKGETLKVYEGVADKRRDYIHVADVASAITKALDAPQGSYHICTGVGTSIIDMAALIIREAKATIPVPDNASGSFMNIETVPDPVGLHPIEYRTGIGDYHLMQWATGWQPKMNVINGVAETIKYFRE